MKAAPIQLHQLSFRRVSVELDVDRLNAGEFDQTDKHFAFDGVLIATNVGFTPMEQGDTQEKNFLLTLQVVIDNKVPDDGSATKPSPYLVDVEAGAIVRVANGAEVHGDVEDLALVNGTSLLWSAIREQVCNLTARMSAGLATLPTVHFQDLRKPTVATAPVQPKRSKSRATKPAEKPTV